MPAWHLTSSSLCCAPSLRVLGILLGPGSSEPSLPPSLFHLSPFSQKQLTLKRNVFCNSPKSSLHWMRLSPLDMGTAFFEEHGTSLQNTGIPGPGSLWMCEGVPVNPLALFFPAVCCQEEQGLCTAALISSQDGTLSGRSAFVESCPNVVTQALGRNCYLHSCSCPPFLFSFFFVSLVLVNILAFLCRSFLPVVPSPDLGGFPPSHVFGQFLHGSKHHCSAARHLDLTSQEYSREGVCGQEY